MLEFLVLGKRVWTTFRESPRKPPLYAHKCVLEPKAGWLSLERLNCVSCRANIDTCATLDQHSREDSPILRTGDIASPVSCSCSAGAPSAVVEGGGGPRRGTDWPAEPGAGRTGGSFSCPGRVVLCLWRVLHHEVGSHWLFLRWRLLRFVAIHSTS